MKLVRAEVLADGKRVGVLSQEGSVFKFRYDDGYFHSASPAISLSLPKTRQEYQANYLFPFFSGLLAQGTNKEMQVRALQLNETDEFARLLETAAVQTIGAVTVRKIAAS